MPRDALLTGLDSEARSCPEDPRGCGTDLRRRGVAREQQLIRGRLRAPPRPCEVVGVDDDRARGPSDIGADSSNPETGWNRCGEDERVADPKPVLRGDRLRQDRPAARAHAARGVSKVALEQLAARDRLACGPRRREHPHAPVLVVEKAGPVQAHAAHTLDVGELSRDMRAERRRREQVRIPGWARPDVGDGIQVARRRVQPSLQVAVRPLDADAAEHRHGAGRCDRKRPGARGTRTQLDDRQERHDAAKPPAQRGDGSQGRVDHDWQQQQQGCGQRHHPGERSRGREQQDRGRGSEAHRTGSCEPGPLATSALRWRVAERGPPREDVAHRGEHRHPGSEQPAADRQREALPRHDALGPDRERCGEVARHAAEQVKRELIAEPQSEPGGEHSQHERVEQQHLDHDGRVVTGQTQVDDQPPPLRDRQQHRAERKQEADERAERREERRRLARGCRSLLEQLDVEVA